MIDARTILVPGVVYSLLLCTVGCWSRSQGQPYQPPPVPAEAWLISAETPGDEETGGPATEFYFELLFLGGWIPGEVFIATTNDKVDVSRYAPGPRAEGVHFARRDVFLVSRAVAAEIDHVLVERKFLQFPSMPDAFGGDGTSWRATVKSSCGKRSVVVSNVGDRDFTTRFRKPEAEEIGPEDDVVDVHAKRIFNLFRQIREIASEKGRRWH